MTEPCQSLLPKRIRCLELKEDFLTLSRWALSLKTVLLCELMKPLFRMRVGLFSVEAGSVGLLNGSYLLFLRSRRRGCPCRNAVHRQRAFPVAPPFEHHPASNLLPG